MTKLIACRAAFFSPCAWPVCEEAGTGEPGYEKYAACPTGWSPHQNDNHGDHASVSGREADQCIRRVPEADRCKKRDCSQSEFETMNRPLNNEPYYFDIKDDGLGTTGRHWFEMN